MKVYHDTYALLIVILHSIEVWNQSEFVNAQRFQGMTAGNLRENLSELSYVSENAGQVLLACCVSWNSIQVQPISSWCNFLRISCWRTDSAHCILKKIC